MVPKYLVQRQLTPSINERSTWEEFARFATLKEAEDFVTNQNSGMEKQTYQIVIAVFRSSEEV